MVPDEVAAISGQWQNTSGPSKETLHIQNLIHEDQSGFKVFGFVSVWFLVPPWGLSNDAR